MARRSKNKSKSHLAVYLIIGAAVIGAMVIGKVVLNKRSQHFVGLSELTVSDMQDGATTLSGNEYRLTGKITQKEKWTPDQGQLINVSVDEGEKGNIPVFVPAGVDKTNLEKGQSYTFKVEINRAGLPVALDIKAK